MTEVGALVYAVLSLLVVGRWCWVSRDERLWLATAIGLLLLWPFVAVIEVAVWWSARRWEAQQRARLKARLDSEREVG